MLTGGARHRKRPDRTGGTWVFSRRVGSDFKIRIGISPQKRNPCQPIFCPDQLACAIKLRWFQKSRCCRKLRAGDLATNGAGRDLHAGIVANPLGFASFGACHDVEVSVFLAEPNRCVKGSAALTESCQADVTLAADLSGDGRGHVDILTLSEYALRSRLPLWR